MSDTLNVVCPNCGAVNRILPGRLGDRPSCGKCHEPVFAGHPVNLDSNSFDRYTGRTNLPVLVDFWAPWCGPCRAMAPAFEEAARNLTPKVLAAKVNTEAAQALAARYNIRSIPTMALFRDGREVDRIAGAMPANQIVNWVSSRV